MKIEVDEDEYKMDIQLPNQMAFYSACGGGYKEFNIYLIDIFKILEYCWRRY